MIDPQRRIAAWKDRYSSAGVLWARPPMISLVKLQFMDARVQTMFPLIAAMELQIKQVLDGLGVSMALYPMYLSFGRRVWRLTNREISGQTKADEITLLSTLWLAYGLDAGVMTQIAAVV